MKVLVLCTSFAPGFRGGSIRAVTHMVERLGHTCAFWVVASNRDSGLSESLAGVVVDRWTPWGQAQVFYASRPIRPSLLGRLVQDVAPDVIFLNSLFARRSIVTLLMRRAGHFRIPIVLAPEGELCAGAMAQKRWRKRAYLTLAKRLGLLDGITWLAREAGEAEDIARIGPTSTIAIVPCLGPVLPLPCPPPVHKVPGRLRLLYLSRITPKKNLAFVLEVLAQCPTGEFTLDIVGPVDSPAYWARCQRLITRLPPNIHVTYRGECRPNDVNVWLSPAHVLVLPTLGENHGYVIAEALDAGRPVLTSDRTPWTALEHARAGWDLPLVRDTWTARLNWLRGIDDAEYQEWSRGARAKSRDAPRPLDVERTTMDLLRRTAHGAWGTEALRHEPG
jgi:glycosyltransferase involved in cell wall biosynthesis